MKFVAPALVAALAVATPAQANSSQLRFAIAPNAADPVWKSKGVVFEKRGECSFSGPGTAPPMAIMGRPATGGGFTAKGPLFNPGFPNPDGSYGSGPDDGFNTLFIQTVLPGDANAVMSCKGAILVNGIDMTQPHAAAGPAPPWPRSVARGR